MNESIKDKVFQIFSYGASKEIQIYNVGINDFNYVKAYKKYRVQANYTIHYVFSGSGVVFLDGKKFNVKEKQLFLLPPNLPIMYYPNEKTPWKYFWFYFDGENVDKVIGLTKFSEGEVVFNCSDYMEIEDRLLRLFDDLQNGNDNYFNILSTFYEVISKVVLPQDKKTYLYNSDLCERIKKTVYLNYSNPEFNVEFISDSLHVSHSYMCKIFKRKENTTVIEFLKNYRLDKAEELLLSENLLNKEICYAVGFKDEAHFMKEFKKRFGYPLKKYKSKES